MSCYLKAISYIRNVIKIVGPSKDELDVKNKYKIFYRECEDIFRIELQFQKLSTNHFNALHNAGLSEFISLCTDLRSAIFCVDNAIHRDDITRARDILDYLLDENFLIQHIEGEYVEDWDKFENWRKRIRYLVIRCKESLEKSTKIYDKNSSDKKLICSINTLSHLCEAAFLHQQKYFVDQTL